MTGEPNELPPAHFLLARAVISVGTMNFPVTGLAKGGDSES